MRMKEATLLFLELLLTLIILGNSFPDEFSIAGYDLSDKSTATEGLELELFEQWRAKHGKVYADPAEKAHRFRNFLKNLAYVREKNAEGGTGSVVGLNVFADLSYEEYSEMYLTRMPIPEETERWSEWETEGKVESCQAPDTLDWREKGAVTGVKSQDTCGSCWAFTATGAMEGINAITTGNLINLSVQELVDCDRTNTGCQKGHMTFAYRWVIKNGGIAAEADYPYIGKQGTCNSAAKDQFKAVKIDGFKKVAILQQDALLCAVAKQPVGVMISASSMDFQLYTGGVYEGNSCTDNPNGVDHAVLIVGYGSNGTADYWIVKNSYGAKWGMNGYVHILRNTNRRYGVCAINYYASYPTKVATSPTSHFGQSLQNNGDVEGETTKKKEIQLRGIKPSSKSVVEESWT